MVPGVWPLQCSLKGSFRFAVEEAESGLGLFIIAQIPFTDLVAEYIPGATLLQLAELSLLGCGVAGIYWAQLL